MNKDNIKFIIDIDGFQVSKTVYYKEVAVYNISDKILYLFHIKLPTWLLDHKHDKPIIFVSKYVHGMLLQNYENDLSFSQFSTRIKSLDPGRQFTWAYKGGIIERDFLARLGLLGFNLETIQCPKFERILENLKLDHLKNCSRHVAFKGRPPRVCHCSGVEVRAFARWLENYLHP